MNFWHILETLCLFFVQWPRSFLSGLSLCILKTKFRRRHLLESCKSHGKICWMTYKSSTHCGKMSILSRRDPQDWMSHPCLWAVSTESYRSAANDISAGLASRRLRQSAVSSQVCGMRLFILASEQREFPDAHLSSPSSPWFQEPQIERLNLDFLHLWPAGIELGLSLWKCWYKNRQRYNHKCRKTRIYSSFVFLTRRWHPQEGNI